MRSLSICCLALICAATLTVASPTKKIEKKSISDELAPKAIEAVDQKAEEAKLNEETLLETPGENVDRAKKATTTFCVEIRNDQPVTVECAELPTGPGGPGGPGTLVHPVHEDVYEPAVEPIITPVVIPPIIPSTPGSGDLPCQPEIAAYLFRKPAEVIYAATGNCLVHGDQHLPGGGLHPSRPGLIPGAHGGLHGGLPGLLPGGLPLHHPLHAGISSGVECTCKSTPGSELYALRGGKSLLDGSSINSAINNEGLALQYLKGLEKSAERQMFFNPTITAGLIPSLMRNTGTPSAMKSSGESSAAAKQASNAPSAVVQVSSAKSAKEASIPEIKQTSAPIALKEADAPVSATKDSAQPISIKQTGSLAFPSMMQSLAPPSMIIQSNLQPPMMMQNQAPMAIKTQAPMSMQEQPVIMIQGQPSFMFPGQASAMMNAQPSLMVPGQSSFVYGQSPVMLPGQSSFMLHGQAPALVQNGPSPLMSQGVKESGPSAAARTVQIFPESNSMLYNSGIPGLPTIQTMDYRGLPSVPCVEASAPAARMDATPAITSGIQTHLSLPALPSLDSVRQMLFDQPRQLAINSAHQMVGMPSIPMLNGGISPFMMRGNKPDCLEDRSGIPLIQGLRFSRDEKDAKAQEEEQKTAAQSGSSGDELDHIIKNGDSKDDSTNARIARFSPLNKEVETSNLLEDY